MNFTKLLPVLPYLLIPLAFSGGIMYEKHTRAETVVNVPPCPECPQCPDALLKVQSLDVSTLKRIRGGLTYSPTYSGTIIVCDSIPN